VSNYLGNSKSNQIQGENLMNKLVVLGLFIFLSLSFATFASAQTKTDAMPVLISMPKPDYPANAKTAGAKGKVSIRVSVNTEGKVTKAVVVRGHKLLRSAAQKAAMNATFEPKIVNGKAVKFTAPLVYNFGG
jgi:TonB family protein